MSTGRLFITCVAAYLTGWPIANAIFNRVLHYMRREAIEAASHEWRDGLADALADRVALRVMESLKPKRGGALTRSGDTITLATARADAEEMME